MPSKATLPRCLQSLSEKMWKRRSQNQLLRLQHRQRSIGTPNFQQHQMTQLRAYKMETPVNLIGTAMITNPTPRLAISSTNIGTAMITNPTTTTRGASKAVSWLGSQRYQEHLGTQWLPSGMRPQRNRQADLRTSGGRRSLKTTLSSSLLKRSQTRPPQSI